MYMANGLTVAGINSTQPSPRHETIMAVSIDCKNRLYELRPLLTSVTAAWTLDLLRYRYSHLHQTPRTAAKLRDIRGVLFAV